MTVTPALQLTRVPNNQLAKNRLNWQAAPVLMLFHVGAVVALFFFTWHALFVAIFLYWVTGGLGLGICYHRLLTHRSYATPKWFEYFLTICGVTAMEGGPLLWVAIHRKHHQFADKEGDPHSPRDGKWWAHAGWVFFGEALRQDVATLKRYVPDLAEDKVHVWLTKYHLAPMAILAVALFAIGGFRLVLWGIFLRTVVGLHATWIVNSAAHIWGSRRFETRDTSTNNWWVALVSFGDGWHNNHHAYPVSARHGLKWYEIDFNWYTIWVFKQVGLASHLHNGRPPARDYANQGYLAPGALSSTPLVSFASPYPEKTLHSASLANYTCADSDDSPSIHHDSREDRPPLRARR
jgi:fatty-acid desaturase